VGRPRRTGLRTAVLLSLMASVGCEDVEPRQAPGFEASRLAELSLGMTYNDVVRVMGNPLQDRSVEPEHVRALFYAEPGARWFLGEYKSNVRGFECILWFREGKLARARVYNSQTGRICHCQQGSCAAAWSQPCFSVHAHSKEAPAG
jgi:hypothetical protein